MSFINVVGSVYRKLFPEHCNDDLSDNLNHRWTVAMLLIMSVVVISQYGDTPIHCWCPAQFTDSHCNYTELYCWVKDTYYIPTDDPIPIDIPERTEKEIKYYQWVPVILITLACLFKLPNLIWKFFNTKCGFNIIKAVQHCELSQMSADRDEEMENISIIFDSWIQTTRWVSNTRTKKVFGVVSMFCFCFGKKTGTFLTSLFFFTKLCYITVSVGLLFLLNKLLAVDYTLYGVEVLNKLSANTGNKESEKFPSTTLCDFEIRQLQNLQRFTVHCVLSVNIYNEAIFAFLWFWFAFLALFGILSVIVWIRKIIVPSQRIAYLNKHLYIIEKSDREKTDDAIVSKFVINYLGADGCFILRLIEYNTNEMVVNDIVKFLWQKWRQKDN